MSEPRPPLTFELLRYTLEESVRLQSHYARLLNDHDGGARRSFASAQEWIDRLRETSANVQLDETAR